jgi:hypothetical protein
LSRSRSPSFPSIVVPQKNYKPPQAAPFHNILPEGLSTIK